MRMSTSIRVSEDTKRALEALKGDDETWDAFLRRLSRTERDVEAAAGFLDDPDLERRVRDAHDDLNDSLDDRDAGRP